MLTCVTIKGLNQRLALTATTANYTNTANYTTTADHKPTFEIRSERRIMKEQYRQIYQLAYS